MQFQAESASAFAIGLIFSMPLLYWLLVLRPRWPADEPMSWRLKSSKSSFHLNNILQRQSQATW